MSGHLRGNWRGTKKSYMISYWPRAQRDGYELYLRSVTGVYNKRRITEQMQVLKPLWGFRSCLKTS